MSFGMPLCVKFVNLVRLKNLDLATKQARYVPSEQETEHLVRPTCRSSLS
jgi:hypothetical protein